MSVVCTAFWIVGLLWDRFFGDNIPVSATIAGAISAAVCLFAFRRGRLRLAPSQQFAELVREFIPRLIASYVVRHPGPGCGRIRLVVRADFS